MAGDFTPAEKGILLPEYAKYVRWCKDWMLSELPPLSFDAWWREYADTINENMEGK